VLSARRFISLARTDLPVAIDPATSTWHGVVPGLTDLPGLHPVRRKRGKRGKNAEMGTWEMGNGKRDVGNGNGNEACLILDRDRWMRSHQGDDKTTQEESLLYH